MKKIEAWLTDLHILNIAGDKETIRIYFEEPHAALKALEALLKSGDVQQG